MQMPPWASLKAMTQLLATSPTDPRQHEWRIRVVERNLGLPVKAAVLTVLFYYLYMSNWMSWSSATRGEGFEEVHHRFAQDIVQLAFLVYAALNVGFAIILKGLETLPAVLVQWSVFTMALIDGLFLAAMTLITGGVESSLYWLYLLLMLRHAVSMHGAKPQIMLNGLMCVSFAAAALLDAYLAELDKLAAPDLSKPFVLKMLLLVSVGVWCYGITVLLDQQLRRLEEVREMTLRREQLEASGRLAAEIAHQLKNPLGIINNAAFTLQRTVKEGKGTITQQIKIIREEVERSDRLITELMGYAQLVEGRVEKLDVPEELDRALLQVFPPAVKYEVQLHRQYAPALPQLLGQRNHISEVFVNLMQNAREAMNGRGNLWVEAAHGDNYSVVITIADDGPGIAPEHLPKVFEPYFSTREKGTGLGLAIVKHNTELYGGKVQVESELGKGSKFTLHFPARTLMKLRK